MSPGLVRRTLRGFLVLAIAASNAAIAENQRRFRYRWSAHTTEVLTVSASTTFIKVLPRQQTESRILLNAFSYTANVVVAEVDKTGAVGFEAKLTAAEVDRTALAKDQLPELNRLVKEFHEKFFETDFVPVGGSSQKRKKDLTAALSFLTRFDIGSALRTWAWLPEPLPEGPVSLGERWASELQVSFMGATMDARVAYRLVALTDRGASLDISIDLLDRGFGTRLHSPSLGTDIVVIGLQGKGSVHFDLRRFTPIAASEQLIVSFVPAQAPNQTNAAPLKLVFDTQLRMVTKSGSASPSPSPGPYHHL
jgi:hypothetical protein